MQEIQPPNLTRRALLGWASAAASGIPASQARAQSPGVSANQIVLGGVFALSGPIRLITEPYEQGIRAHLNRVNAEGGINGRQIQWLVEDDSYQPSRSLAAAKKLVERDNVFALFGQLGTPTTAAMVPYAEQVKVPFFTATVTPDPKRRFTFGLATNYSDTMLVVTRYLLKDAAKRRVAYFYQNDDLGASARAGVERALSEAGARLVADVGYERGTSDFSTYLLKLKESNADAVISMGTANSTATALKQGLAIGFRPLWVAGAGGSYSIMEKMLGPETEGMLFATEVEPQYSESPGMRELAALIAKQFPGAPLDMGTVVGYAHARLITGLLKQLGQPPSRDALMALLDRGCSIETGVSPPLTFSSAKKNGANGLRIYQWVAGKPAARTDWILPSKG